MEFMRITSRQNSAVIAAASLYDRKNRREHGLFITEGLKIYKEAAKESIYPRKIFIREGENSLLSFFNDEKNFFEAYLLADSVFEKLDRERSPDGLILVYEMPFKKSPVTFCAGEGEKRDFAGAHPENTEGGEFLQSEKVAEKGHAQSEKTAEDCLSQSGNTDGDCLARSGKIDGDCLAQSGKTAEDCLSQSGKTDGDCLTQSEKVAEDALVRSEKTAGQADLRQLILERIQDPGNLGTIIRSAAALGFDRILLSGCADIYSSKTVRASMGAVFRIPIEEYSDIEGAANKAKEDGAVIYASVLSPDAEDINKISFSFPAAIMIGNEGSGLSQKAISLCQRKVTIPMRGAESLNASAAAAVFMWEMGKEV